MSKCALSEIPEEIITELLERPANVITSMYNSPFLGSQLGNIPDNIKEIIFPIIKKLEKYDLNLIFDGYYNNLIFYHIEGLSTTSRLHEEKYILTNSVLNFAKLRARNIKFVELIK